RYARHRGVIHNRAASEGAATAAGIVLESLRRPRPPETGRYRMTLMDRLREPRVAALVGIVLAVAIGAFLLLRNNDDSGSGPEATNGAEATTVSNLQSVASAADHPVYWAGEEPGKQYELTITSDGNIFIRYLDPST